MATLKALKNFSYNGMKLIGDTFEEDSKKNVAFFEKRGLAKVVEEDKPQDNEEDEFLDEDVSFDDEEEKPDVDAELTAAGTHAELDAIQEKLGLDLPGKDQLTLAQRKAKIRSELKDDAE